MVRKSHYPTEWRTSKPPTGKLILAVFNGFPYVARREPFYNYGEWVWRCFVRNVQYQGIEYLDEVAEYHKDPEMWLPMPVEKEWRF